MMRRFVGSVFVLAVIAMSAGCGQRLAGGKVSGKVSLDGQAIPAGAVFMASADGKRYDSGPIHSDGTYVIPNAPLGAVKIGLVIPSPPPVLPPMPKLPDAPEIKAPATEEKLSAQAVALLAKIPARYK